MLKTFTLTLLALAACDVDDTNLGYSHLDTPRTRWAATVPAGPDAYGVAVAIDSLGDVIGAGSIGGHGFITKRVASDGSERWIHHYSGSGSQTSSYVQSAVVDAEDNIVVTGGFAGTIDFDGHTLSGPPAWASVFVAKYAPNGDLVWLRSIDGTASMSGMAALVDRTGQIIVTGQASGGTIVLAGAAYSVAGGFLLALDADGNEQWGHAFDGGAGWYLAAARNGDILVSGQFSGPTSFGGAVITPFGDDIGTYVARFRPDGLFLASRAFGPEGGTSGYGWLTVHPDGPIIVQSLDHDSPNTWQYLALHVVDDEFQDLWTQRTDDTMFHLTSSSSGLVGVGMEAPPWGPGGDGVLTRWSASGDMERGTFGRAVDSRPVTSIRNATATDRGLAFIGEQAGTWDFGTGPVTGNGDILIVSFAPLGAAETP